MSKIKVEPHLGCNLITFDPIEDQRGYFYESFNKNLSDIVGFWPMQENTSKSFKNVVRGLHLQYAPPAAKLVRVLAGKIQDVAVDCRRSSPNYGRHVSIILDDSLPQWFHVPEGFAHGFCVLSDYAIVNYYVSQKYNPNGEVSINAFSHDLKINWSIHQENAIMSEKDKKALEFEDFFV